MGFSNCGRHGSTVLTKPQGFPALIIMTAEVLFIQKFHKICLFTNLQALKLYCSAVLHGLINPESRWLKLFCIKVVKRKNNKNVRDTLRNIMEKIKILLFGKIFSLS